MEKSIEKLSNLNHLQRILFFELLAHNLTVVARGSWSDASLLPEEQVEALKIFNECLHRVVARIGVERLQTHEWKDSDFINYLIDVDYMLHPKLKGSVKQAFDWSYNSTLNSK